METAELPAEGRSDGSTYWLTRFVLLRLLGAVYAVAFLVAANQIVPLIGSDGLLPVGSFLQRVAAGLGSTSAGFERLPSIFWFGHSDAALAAWAWAGFALSCVVAAGFANALLMAALWFLYMSFVHVGQDWYGYGWEIQLLETGFLAIFLCPLLDARPFPKREAPKAVIVLFRWLIFRIMLGAGLIKIRGDPAWRDLTALFYHFETQPLPNGLSRFFDFFPRSVLRGGVVLNHLAELAAPWFVFWPRAGRRIAGTVIILFQVVLIFSGNLSFLNWLTIVPALACFDDAVWRRILPGPIARRAREAEAAYRRGAASPGSVARFLSSRGLPALDLQHVVALGVAVLVAGFSVSPVLNMISPGQIMNTSFNPLDLVNTYGAFGTVGRERTNVVFEGTDSQFPDELAVWKPYPYKGLPVDPACRPPQIAPYQLRLDWQMWFAAMDTYRDYPWTLNLVWKLLHNDPGTLSLFAGNPFPKKPPRYIRAVLYKYAFAKPGNPQGLWWTRQSEGLWLPPLSADNADFRRVLAAMGWLPAERPAP